MFGCLWIRSLLHSVRFGQLLRCSHKRIVNIMKVYIERNNISGMIYDSVKNNDFIDFGNFEVGTYFRERRAHCYPLRVATGSGGAGRFGTWRLRYTPFRDIFNSVNSHFRTSPIRNIVTSGHVISGQARFGTAHNSIICTGSLHSPSASSALIRYYSLCLWLSRSSRDREWMNRLVKEKCVGVISCMLEVVWNN